MLSGRTVKIMIPFIIAALVCYIIGAAWIGKADSYESRNEVLDQSTMEVLGMATVAGGASAVLTVLDQDPVAEEFAELFEYFILILAVLYFEKFLMPLFGVVAFKWVIPLCIIMMGITYVKNSIRFRNLIAKIAIGTFILYLIIPISVSCMSYIRSSFSDLYDSTVGVVAQTSVAEDIENIIEDELPQEALFTVTEAEDNHSDTSEEAENSEGGSLISNLWNGASEMIGNAADAGKQFFSDAKETVTEIVTDVSDNVAQLGSKVKNYAENLLKQLTTAIAIMLISSCLIPILTFLVFAAFIKMLFGFDFFVETENASSKISNMLESGKYLQLLNKIEKKAKIDDRKE